jgi:hypothetical protein
LISEYNLYLCCKNVMKLPSTNTQELKFIHLAS